MTEVTLFKNRHKNTSIILSNGATVGFVNGRYHTTHPKTQALLTGMAKEKEAGVYIDPEEPTVDPEAVLSPEQARKLQSTEYKRKHKMLVPQGRVTFSSTTDGEVKAETPGTPTVVAVTPIPAPSVKATDLKAVLASKKSVPIGGTSQ